MSTLTEEQKRKIEESRKKALSLRAGRSQTNATTTVTSPGVKQNFSSFSATQTQKSPQNWSGQKAGFPKNNLSGRPPISSTGPGNINSNQTSTGPKSVNFNNNNTIPPVSSTGSGSFNQSSSTNKFQAPVSHHESSGDQSSSYQAKPIQSFYSISSKAQKRSLYQKKSSERSNKYGAKNSFVASSPSKNAPGVVTARCSLVSRGRFDVDVKYCAPLIELFKSMKTRQYDMQTKTWSFEIQEHDELVQKVQKQMSDAVSIVPLTRSVVIAFTGPKPTSTTPVDLSAVDGRLVSTLLPFQKTGVEYAITHNGRVLIADDMGLGKTIQALCVAEYYRKEWPLLIVVPSSVRFSWRQQILRFLPDIDPQDINVMVTGKDKSTSGLINILSYDLMVRNKKDLLAKAFKVIIMDESHFLKNSKTARTQTAVPLLKKARRALLLSGTPALSRPSELFPQISVIQPKLFPKFHDFGLRYCNGKEMQWGWDYSGSSNLKELNLILEEHVMIRRLKKDVLDQLPAKIRQMVVLDSSAIKIDRSMKVSHKQVEKNKGSEKRTALLSYFHETAEAKTPAVRQYILDMLESGSKILVFAHHQLVLNALEEAVKTKYSFIRIDGRTTPEQRNFYCNKFQMDEDVKVALLSITAANAGLNLTAACVVVFAELFWNPGILVQAEDRAHRIGQNDSVSVHYLVAKDTADDYIWPLVKQKLDVLGQVGLSKEDFTDADTKHLQDPNQRDIMEFIEQTFIEAKPSEDVSGNSDENVATEAHPNDLSAAGSSNLLRYFKPEGSSSNKKIPSEDSHHSDLNLGESANQDAGIKSTNQDEDTGSEWSDDACFATIPDNGKQDDNYDWLDDDEDFGDADFGENDPEEPSLKKARLTS